MSTSMTLPDYPLLFDPIYKAKVWGGRTLEKLGRTLPDTEQGIGESWELADLAQTSASGGGGSAEFSVINNGHLQGQTIRQVLDTNASAVLGSAVSTPGGAFPLLLKLLDARENLSVQVHPSPKYAAQHDDAHLKSEAWYIVDCEPGAKIYKGIREGVTPEQLREALETNTDEAVVPLMIDIEVEPGDCHYLPSGTCHALGSGVLVAEVQTPSDTTFRVYDWGRTGRELHIEQALACIEFGPAQTEQYEKQLTVDSGQGISATRLVTCEFFTMTRLSAPASTQGQIGQGLPKLWMVLQGSGTITCDSTAPESATTTFSQGQTILLPAAMSSAHFVLNQDCTVIEVTLPEQAPGQLA